ncbi:MAG TPA: ergothioneine biosynthesis protein EgtB [Solirubrobacteraceae bacterium]|nr:ergothioneine biosynthesis protein EgtB [Solirubrobacteraceae bacterium]
MNLTAAAPEIVQALEEARERTLHLVGALSDDELTSVHSPLMSPLVWDLGHIAAFEDLWLVHRYGGRPLLHDELADVYDAFETPRAGRGELDMLGPEQAREYLAEVRERTLSVIEERGADPLLHELVLRHEHQHNETMLQTLQLAGLDGWAPVDAPRARAVSSTLTGLELAEVPAGPCTIGAGPRGFAYDNERPCRSAELAGFAIGRTPVTNGAYLEFVHAGGYEQREHWSAAGWEWRLAEGIDRPGGWSEDLTAERRLGSLVPLHPLRPVIHVSWYEADAFARSHGVRLPTEAEWEKAATWDEGFGGARLFPWGAEPPVPGVHANLDRLTGLPALAGAYPAGSSPYGCLGMIGDVWEWTASPFGGYPGFVPEPYREYSEVFFGEDYKVLRGGSWATRARVATPTFRNWDFPQRRQIFSGFRLASTL